MDLSTCTVAVTGATGFLGRYLCEELLSKGAKVVGVVRTPDRVPSLIEAGVEMRKADLMDRPALERAFEGVDAVVSNAALFDLSNQDWQAHHRANIEGGANVIEATAAAGVRRFVTVSSCATYVNDGKVPPTEDDAQFHENSKQRPWNRYSISKALSEQDAWRRAEAAGLQMTAIRPSGVYGAHDPNITPRMLGMARRHLSLPFVELSLVYGADVAEAVRASLERPAAIGRAYNTAGAPLPANAFLDALRDAYGIKSSLRFPLPLPLRLGFDSSRAESELGFRNRSYAEGLAETLLLEG